MSPMPSHASPVPAHRPEAETSASFADWELRPLRTSPELKAFRVDGLLVDGGFVFHLAGELDVDTADCLKQALHQAHDQGARSILLDLSALEFIDAAGLSQLVIALKRQRASGGDIVLHGPRSQTLRVLEMVGLTEVFRITEDAT